MKHVSLIKVLGLTFASYTSLAYADAYLANASSTDYMVAAKSVDVFEKNNGKGEKVCTLPRNTKVSSRWDNQSYVLIETDKRTNCKGWVIRKALKPA